MLKYRRVCIHRLSSGRFISGFYLQLSPFWLFFLFIITPLPHPWSIFHLEEDWERELEAELQDYEVVVDHQQPNKNDNWEQEIDDLLDDTDLK